MAVVVDTDVVSFIFKSDTRATLYRPHLNNQIAVISFMTFAELEQWAFVAVWGANRQRQLKAHLRRYVVQHSSNDICRLWAETMSNARRKGSPMGVADAWIAATALYLQSPLITHNRNHFDDVDGLNIISES